MRSDLQALIADAYNAKVLSRGDITHVHSRFLAKKEDAEFVATARAEMARLKPIARVNPVRCFVSKASFDFLSEALSKLDNT